MNTRYSQQDLEQVTTLLGRKPRGLFEVVKYHPKEKHPMVIKVLPWVEKAPFPTTFWLTCPLLKKQLSHLEKDKMIGHIEKECLSEDLLESLRQDHRDYRDLRVSFFEQTIGNWDLLPEAQQKMLKTTGIGGIADFDHVKCLHLHYAYHLACESTGGRTIGRLVDELAPHIKTYYGQDLPI